MDAPTHVTRTVDLDIAPDELWELIGDGERWIDWMVDDADVAVEPGTHGRVADDGAERDVHIKEVVDGELVSFQWWPRGLPDQLSTVELRVIPAIGGSQLHIVETFPAPRPSASASTAWSLRAGRLCVAPPVRLQLAA
jgi:uncharacterized protein YndB with AHSA1/START domain